MTSETAPTPTLRELLALKRACEAERYSAEAWAKFREAELRSGFVKGLIVYLAD